MPGNTERIKLTDTRIKKLIKQETPDSGRVYFIDKEQPALRMHLSSSGRVTFQFYKWDSIRKRPAAVGLGTYPALSIKAARDLCEKHAADVAAGIDVAKRKSEAKAEENLDDAFKRYIDEYAKDHKRDWLNDQRRYNKYIKDEIGKKRVSDITGETAQKLQNRLLKRPKERGDGTLSPSTVNRVLALISSIYGVTHPKLPNPAKEVKKKKEHGAGRPLQPHEFPAFWQALDAETERPDVADAIRLLVLTGQRRSNVFGMKWNDLDLDRTIPVLAKDEDNKDTIVYESAPVWRIRHEEYKADRDVEIALTPIVVEVLDRIKSNRSKSVHVFPAPGSNGSKPINDVRRPWNRIKARAGISIRLHDLRHSYGTFLAAAGSNSMQIKQAMGHKNLSTSEKYVTLQSDAVRRSVELAQQAMLGSQAVPKVVNISGNRDKK